jgi:YggT family protein
MLHALIDIGHYLLTIASRIIIIQVILSWLFAFNIVNTSSQGSAPLRSQSIASVLFTARSAGFSDFGGIDFRVVVLIRSRPSRSS